MKDLFALRSKLNTIKRTLYRREATMSSVRVVVGQACTLRHPANDPPMIDSICCNATNMLRKLCTLKGKLSNPEVFNQQSNEGDRLRYEAMLKAKLAQMKIAETKRVAKLRESIPKTLDDSLKARASNIEEKLQEYNTYAKNQNKIYEMNMMMNEEEGSQKKSNLKIQAENANMKSIEAQASKVAEEREAAIIVDPEIITATKAMAAVSSFVEEKNENEKVKKNNDDGNENPYAEMMTDAHAEVALARDELKDKRLKRQRLAESVTDEVRKEQVESEHAFRKYLMAKNKDKLRGNNNNVRDPFLRSKK